MAVLVFAILIFRPQWVVIPPPLGLLILFPAALVLMAFMVYYFGVYPILHVARRHQGSHQNAWLVWLTLELCGFGFGVVRLAYLFAHILPDIRHQAPYQPPTRA